MKRLLIQVVIATGIFTSCKESPHVTPVQSDTLSPLLKTIEWKDLNMRANLLYNTDSTLQRIVYNGAGGVSSVTEFSYGANKSLSGFANSTSLFKTVLTYNTAGQLVKQDYVLKDNGTYYARKRLEFDYDSQGNLSELSYYLINELGPNRVFTNQYEYDNQNQPVKIVTTDKNQNQILTTIEEYSVPLRINPLYFISAGIDENYFLYNIPLLGKLKRLPAFIRQQRMDNGKVHLEKIHKIAFQVDNRLINEQVNTTEVFIPAPSTSTSELRYLY
jgi:hypothetical protein